MKAVTRWRLREAIEAVYPQAQIQTCIVHLIRNSTTLASWKDRKELATALKPIYYAANADAAAAALDEFEAGPWGVKFPTVAGCGAGSGNRSFRSSRTGRKCEQSST